MSKIRGAKRFFRIGKEPSIVPGTSPYGTPAKGFSSPTVTGANFDMRFFHVSEGNFSLKAVPTVEEQPVLRGQIGVAFREKTGVQVSGDVGVLAHPETIRYFMDASMLRDANSELYPHTIQEFYPGIDATEKGTTYRGCKVSQLAGAWGTGSNKVTLTSSWQGQAEYATGGTYGYTGTLPDVTQFPTTKSGYFFTTSALVDFSLTGALTLPAPIFTDVNFTIQNNLAEGPRLFDPDVSLRGAITDLIAGQERLSGGFTMQWADLTPITRLRNFSDIVMRNIFIHPTADSTKTFTGTQAASAVPVTITTSASMVSLFPSVSGSNPYVIAIQHKTAGATTQWSTAFVTAVSATDITISSLDVAVASGDVIWTEAMEIRFNTINMTDISKSGGPDDAVVTLQGTFDGKSTTGGSQLTYRTKGSGLPQS